MKMRPKVLKVSNDLSRMSISSKLREIKRLCPMLSDVDVTIIEKGGPKDDLGCSTSEYNFIKDSVLKDFCDDGDHREDIRIVIRGYICKVYQIKRNCGSTYSGEKEGVEDTYVAIVEADNIPDFIKKSGEMIYEDIDPLDYGKHHKTEVYVYWPSTIPPVGLSDLLSRSATVHLVINEEVVDEMLGNDLLANEYNHWRTR